LPPGYAPRVLRWVVRGLLLVALSFANLNDIWSPDVIPNALFSWTVIREGNVDYDEFTDRLDVPPQERIGVLMDLGIPRDTYFFRACGPRTTRQTAFLVLTKSPRSPGGPPPPGPEDHVCSIFPPGIGILALPVLAPFVLARVPPLDITTLVRAGHLAAAIIEALATLLLWSVLRRFTSARWALALALLYFLGTSVRTVASQALWQHSGVHLAVAGALWLVMEERAITLWRDFLAGVALGLGTVVRQTTAIVGAGVALGRPRGLAALVVGAVLGVIPLLAYDAIAFGDPFEQGYGGKPFDTPLATGLYGLLLSPSRGLLVYEPYLVAALAALVLAWRAGGGAVASRLRGLSIAWLATLALYATYAEWWGGRVFGPRFLDDQAPILFVALAWGIGRGLLARRAAHLLFWVAAGWSLVLFQAAAFVYDQRWDTEPVNVNFAPQRLFDWGDPQWLAVLRALPAGGARVLVALVLSAALVALLIRLEGVRMRASPA